MIELLKKISKITIAVVFICESSFANVAASVNQNFLSDVNQASQQCTQSLNRNDCQLKFTSGKRPGAKVKGSGRTSCHAHGLALDAVLNCGGKKESPQSNLSWNFGQCMSKKVYTCLASSSRGQKIGGCSASTHLDHFHFGGCGREKGPSQTANYAPTGGQYASALNDAGVGASPSGADYNTPSYSFGWTSIMKSMGYILMLKLMLDSMDTTTTPPPKATK